MRRYLVDNILPARQFHIFSGASGAGKTTLMLQLFRDLLDGKPWFSHTTHPPKSFAYVACDRDVDEYEEKFAILGIKPFPITSLVMDESFQPARLGTPAGRKEAFPQLWAKLGHPELMVFDPISPFLPSDLKDYHTVMDALIWFCRFLGRVDSTLWGSHHAGKLRMDAQFARAQDRSNGSGALLGYSGTQIFLTDRMETKDQLNHILTINPHNAPLEEHKLTRDEKTGGFQVDAPVEEVVRELKLLKLVPEAPEQIPLGDLVEQGCSLLDCSSATLRRLIDRLISKGIIYKPAHGLYARSRPS